MMSHIKSHDWFFWHCGLRIVFEKLVLRINLMLLKSASLTFFGPHFNFWVILTAKWKEVSKSFFLHSHLAHMEYLLEQKEEPFCDSLGANFQTNTNWSFEKSEKAPFASSRHQQSFWMWSKSNPSPLRKLIWEPLLKMPVSLAQVCNGSAVLQPNVVCIKNSHAWPRVAENIQLKINFSLILNWNLNSNFNLILKLILDLYLNRFECSLKLNFDSNIIWNSISLKLSFIVFLIVFILGWLLSITIVIPQVNSFWKNSLQANRRFNDVELFSFSL